MRLAFKNIFRRKIRTLLSLLGVAVGVGSIIAFAAMGEGFKKSIDDYADQTGADFIVMRKGVADPGFSRIMKEDLDLIRSDPNVRTVARAGAIPATLTDRNAPILLLGRVPDEPLIQSYDTPNLKGRLIQTTDEVMVGIILAEELGITLGDTLPMFDKEFSVVGIFSTAVSFENGSVICHQGVVVDRLRLTEGSSQMAFVYLNDHDAADQTKERLEAALPDQRIIASGAFSDNFDQFDYIDDFIWVVSLAALIVGAIGILNTMLMSVSERIREIGTLRAFGWSPRMVLGLIFTEGLYISVLGGLAGIPVGIIGAEVLMRLAPQGILSPSYSVEIFVRGVSIALVLGAIGALYPAWRAGRLAPAEALRYE